MRLFRFDDEVGHPIEQFGSSHLVMSPIQRMSGQLQIGCMHLGPGGLVGHHQAGPSQLFLVVQGTGWVRSGDLAAVPIRVGQAAFWESGEWHSAGSDAGMAAIVVEGESLDPSQFMPEGLTE